ncbi:hypothetical protein RBH29_10480 [Herbivorax sp. ANBcel31]|uniref:hypothetical protein n=1 Tax=Herbivorax sp. ANBcel31 TaxID=3069754 RepID=UPI0027B31015|nr:hypothetical protein [Herbivorax sp. ANBcel31]MDQ2086851.1 hypothetical protein [Herbivorax sp. ANBcel31]
MSKISFERGENMDGYKTLYNIANGIFAAGKIGEVLYSPSGNERNQIDTTNTITNACEILDILSRYAPEEQREALGEVAKKGKLCLETCNNLNRHFSTYTRGVDIKKTVEALNIIKPIFGNRERMIVDRVLKLYEALS